MNKQLRPIMFVGTGSDVGKSILSAAFCRIFLQDGFAPAPFKAQNMSLNSYVTPIGGEIGRAQAVQAEACNVLPHTDMNPVLLKPTTNCVSQVILHGKPIGSQSATEYFLGNNKENLFQEALQAFVRLSEQFSPVVLEGAGSISELNLKDRDITNMRMAIATGASVYLVADIDKGGVFANVYGTIALLSESEKNAIKGIIINKFRGDISLFSEGKEIIENLTGKPVVGIIPYFSDIYIDDEDSVSLRDKNDRYQTGKVNICIVLTSKMSNFTDFALLETISGVNVYYSCDCHQIGQADIIILPGSKNTIADLKELHQNGVADSVKQAFHQNKTIIGICGGYQMLGNVVRDPDGIDGGDKEISGLGILPVETVNVKDKITCQESFYFKGNDSALCHGYEIHMGRTDVVEGANKPLLKTSSGNDEGYMLSETVWGTYMHGIFDNASVVEDILKPFASKIDGDIVDFNEFKSKQYDKLATLVRNNVDMDTIYTSITVDNA